MPTGEYYKNEWIGNKKVFNRKIQRQQTIQQLYYLNTSSNWSVVFFFPSVHVFYILSIMPEKKRILFNKKKQKYCRVPFSSSMLASCPGDSCSEQGWKALWLNGRQLGPPELPETGRQSSTGYGNVICTSFFRKDGIHFSTHNIGMQFLCIWGQYYARIRRSQSIPSKVCVHASCVQDMHVAVHASACAPSNLLVLLYGKNEFITCLLMIELIRIINNSPCHCGRSFLVKM